MSETSKWAIDENFQHLQVGDKLHPMCGLLKGGKGQWPCYGGSNYQGCIHWILVGCRGTKAHDAWNIQKNVTSDNGKSD